MKQLSIFLHLILIVLFNSKSFANSELSNKVSLGFGMASHGFSQLESAFPEDEVGTGSASILIIQGQYEGFTELDKSFFGTLSFSGLGGEVEKYYSMTGGMKYYFSKFGTKAKLIDDNFFLDIQPKFTYYLGWELGVASVVYQANDEVRSDLGVLFGGLGGVSYSANAKTSYSFELHILKGQGVETESMDTQVLFGITYYVEPLF